MTCTVCCRRSCTWYCLWSSVSHQALAMCMRVSRTTTNYNAHERNRTTPADCCHCPTVRHVQARATVQTNSHSHLYNSIHTGSFAGLQVLWGQFSQHCNTMPPCVSCVKQRDLNFGTVWCDTSDYWKGSLFTAKMKELMTCTYYEKSIWE